MTDQVNDLASWSRLIDSLQNSDASINIEDLTELTKLFLHLPTQTAPRLQRDYESNTNRSHELFGEIFDKIDLSNKPLLCSYLKMLKSFAYFRTSQIVYHVEPPHNVNQNPIYFPVLTKVKWYDLKPLLPEAGTIGWKAIMNHGLVKEEHKLMQACIELLSQKIHFLVIIYLMDQFQEHKQIIHKNGCKVADKLFELIRDVAYDDEQMIGINSELFRLLLPFTDKDKQVIIIDATVQDLFKPYRLQKSMDEDIAEINHLIIDCLMTKSNLQDVLISRTLDHFKCNIIRRKRRHSVENPHENGQSTTLEGLVDEIIESKGNVFGTMLERADNVKISAKYIQTAYLTYWIQAMDTIVSNSILAPKNSLKIICTCSVVISSASEILNNDLILGLSKLVTKTIEKTAQARLDHLFKAYDPIILLQFTRSLSAKSDILSKFDTPLLQFYITYLDRFIKFCVIKDAKAEANKFTEMVTSICDKSLNKDTSRLLQYICLRQLAGCMEIFSNRPGNVILDTFMNCAKTCSERLYKSIKKYSVLKIEHGSNDDDDDDDDDPHDGNTSLCLDSKRLVMIDSMICVLRIAIERKDRTIADVYGDLLFKLYGAISFRIERMVKSSKCGETVEFSPIDSQIIKLLVLYIKNKDRVKAYLRSELIESLSTVIVQETEKSESPIEDKSITLKRKTLAKQIISGIDGLTTRAEKSKNVYPMIINKQYSLIEQISSAYRDLKEKEKSCCYSYSQQMKILSEVTRLISGECEPIIYEKFVKNAVFKLENCDPFDHPALIYHLIILESLIPQANSRFHTNNKTFINMIPRISSCLMRITTSVEFGPSIHAFTKPSRHSSHKSIQCCTYSNCIKIYTLIFQRLPPEMTEPFISDAIGMCIRSNLDQYAKHAKNLHKSFVQQASAISATLKSISIRRKDNDLLKYSMPIYLDMLSTLIRCLILASDRNELENKSPQQLQINGHDGSVKEEIENSGKTFEKQLEIMAIEVGKTLNNLCSFRVRLVEYAPHIIVTYITDIQRASCPDYVRLHLNEGIFRLFNLLDAHQRERQEELIEKGVQRKTHAGRAKGSFFDMMHARISQASREILRDMYDQYTRFHRYLAKC